MRNKEREK